MSKIADYIMRGRKQAVIVALACTLIPFLDWLAVVIMALITLRKGAAEGVIILLWIALPAVVMALLGHPVGLLYGVICGSLLVWILAITLRHVMSWTIVLELAVVCGVIGVVIAHQILPNIIEWWTQHLFNYFQRISNNFDIEFTKADIHLWANYMARIATGIQAAMLLLTGLFNLALARAWQALLFNPGGLRKELFGIRLQRATVLILVIFALLALTGNETVLDCLPVVVLPFVLAGFSLIHCFAASTKVWWVWLSGFYGILILFFPYVLMLLLVLALADSWLDFRARFNLKCPMP